MRSLLGLAASALAGLAATIASLDGDADIVPFFVGLTVLGGVEAWAAHPPFEGPRRRLATGAALLWLVAVAWVGVLLVMSVTVWQASGPPPGPEATYAGLTATVYHVIGLFGGAILVAVSAFGPDPWFRQRSGTAGQVAS
ncbi:MAG TPA: hypothetical protein VMP86_06705 [Candidatus Binatia bacterium]|nr:hypothetical protein [Candidatus Binatia bacterium]